MVPQVMEPSMFTTASEAPVSSTKSGTYHCSMHVAPSASGLAHLRGCFYSQCFASGYMHAADIVCFHFSHCQFLYELHLESPKRGCRKGVDWMDNTISVFMLPRNVLFYAIVIDCTWVTCSWMITLHIIGVLHLLRNC